MIIIFSIVFVILKPEIKIGDVETTTAGVRSVTEENKDDDFDFRVSDYTTRRCSVSAHIRL